MSRRKIYKQETFRKELNSTMGKIEIKSRRIDWKEVSEEKAIRYAKVLLEGTGIKKYDKDRYVNFLNRYIWGLDLNKI